MGLELLSLLRLLLPSGGDGLPLSEELDCTLSVEVAGSPEAGLASSKGEHRQGNWDGQVDADLAAFDLVLELSGDVAVLCENSSSVSVGVAVDKLNGLLQSVHTGDDHDGPKDLVVIAVHAWLDVVNNGGANEVAVGEAVNLDVSSIEEDLGLLGARLDEFLDSFSRFLGDQRSDVWVVDTSACGELSGSLDNFWNPLLSVSDEYSDGDSHASLAGRSEASSDQCVNSIVLISVGHHDGVVLGAHVALNTLSSLTASLVDILTSLISTNEGDRLNVGMSADIGHRLFASLDNVNDAIGNA